MAVRRKTLIIGAGIIGVSLAYVMARRGGDDVLVVDAEPDLAQGVTALGSGGYRVQFTSPEEVALTVRTIAAWKELESRHHVSLGFHRGGYLTLGSTDRAVATMRSAVSMQRAQGAEVHLIDRDDLAEVVPGMRTDDVPVAAYSPGDGWGHPPTVTRLLGGLARDAGARFRFDTRVTELHQRSGRVTGVSLTTGGETEFVTADVVVNAAGLGSPTVAELAGVPLRLGMWRQHQFRTAPVPGVHDTAFPCVLDPVHDLYLRPDGDSVLVGYTEAWDADRLDYAPNPTIAEHARERLAERWSAAATEPFVRTWVGCYELTPDRRAYIGIEPALDGYAYSTGYSGHGLMNSFGAAEALAAALDGETPSVPLGTFDRRRFERSGSDTTLHARSDDAW
jgi:sarcosine oxidase subunit beta